MPEYPSRIFQGFNPAGPDADVGCPFPPSNFPNPSTILERVQ